MKFSDGYWLTQERYQIQSPQEVYEVSQNTDSYGKDSIEAYATYKKIKSRGDTLNIGNSKINLFSPMSDIIGVHLTHFDKDDHQPQYTLHHDQSKAIVTIQDGKTTNQGSSLEAGKAKLTTNQLEAELSTNDNFSLKFFYTDNQGDKHLLTESKPGGQGSIEDLSTGLLHSLSVNGMQGNSGNINPLMSVPTHYMKETLNIDVDTKLYGTGERFTSFIKNGQSIDILNKDGGTGSEQSYKNIPFYLACKPGIGKNNGLFYGVFVNHTQQVSFEFASEDVGAVQFSTQGEDLEYYIISGESAKEVLGKFNKLIGGGTLPPPWSFGLWLSTSFTTDYSEKTVLSFIEGMEQRDIPLDVFHFDCFWMKGFEWSNFEWDKSVFPDPEGLLKKIHEKGLKICVWINPYISQKSKLFQEGKEKNFFIKHSDGSVWQSDLWQAGTAFIDFTNPDAVSWFQDKLSRLLDMGVDCFKTDFGERIPIHDAQFFDGSNSQGAHNYYTFLYNKAVYDILKEKKGKQEAVVFSRSATIGSQKFPVHWGGDNISSYQSMADTLRGGLSFLISGFNFWSHDIGGFEEETPSDLYKRWTQFGLLSSHSRYHGNVQYRVPWLFDEEAVEVTRKFTKLKVQMMPYLYKQADRAVKQGLSLMRPMFLEFPNDPTNYYLDLQYMLGESLLVAPIFNEEGIAKYYLPKGKWTRLVKDEGMSDEVISQGEWFEEKHSFLSLPLFIREGHTIELDTKLKKAGDFHLNFE